MSQPYIGQISMFAGNFAPAGWAFCQGQIMPISENETLFNLIGTIYGGDGQETFALPNLSSRVALHMGQGGGLSNYVLGQAGGVETVTLTTQQIPQHIHAALALTGTPGNLNTPGAGTVLADQQIGLGSSSPYTYTPFNGSSPNQVTMPSATVQNTGGSQPHENIQPIMGMNFIISLFGVYPTQS